MDGILQRLQKRLEVSPGISRTSTNVGCNLDCEHGNRTQSEDKGNLGIAEERGEWRSHPQEGLLFRTQSPPQLVGGSGTITKRKSRLTSMVLQKVVS